ncbi:MAG: hypothetical protein WA763_08950, partial [Pseudolabrys sp.]
VTREPSGHCRGDGTRHRSSLLQHEMLADVRFGSKADICSALGDVRFTQLLQQVMLDHACGKQDDANQQGDQ